MAREWKDISRKDSLGWIELVFVDCDTQEILSKISNHKNITWYVWKNGAGYGEFITKEAAQKKAESIA